WCRLPWASGRRRAEAHSRSRPRARRPRAGAATGAVRRPAGGLWRRLTCGSLSCWTAAAGAAAAAFGFSARKMRAPEVLPVLAGVVVGLSLRHLERQHLIEMSGDARGLV